jgi:hypothetical protein
LGRSRVEFKKFRIKLRKENKMGIFYRNLDGECRQFMLEELRRDISGGILYISNRLNEIGSENWKTILEEAIQNHDDVWLGNKLRTENYINDQEQRKKPTGGFTIAKVPVTAPEILAEGEFNRFYTRGLCLKAIKNGFQDVLVYRGKEVQNPRAESQLMVGKKISAIALLGDLRKSQGVEPALGLPPGPNSGLTICLP